MKIIAMSDSHGRDDRIEKIIKQHPMADLYIFLGDGLSGAERVFQKHPELPFTALPGNCDLVCEKQPPSVTLNFEDGILTACHGHTFGVKYGLSSYKEYARERGAALALFGHTHVPLEVNEGGTVLFNPGAVCLGSYGIVYLERGKVLCSHGEIY